MQATAPEIVSFPLLLEYERHAELLPELENHRKRIKIELTEIRLPYDFFGNPWGDPIEGLVEQEEELREKLTAAENAKACIGRIRGMLDEKYIEPWANTSAILLTHDESKDLLEHRHRLVVNLTRLGLL